MDWLKRLKEGERDTKTFPPSSQPEALPRITNGARATAPLSFLAQITTGTGRTVYVATDNKAATLAPAGAALFTRQEIEALKGISREMAEKIIAVKEVFHGAMVENEIMKNEASPFL